jgi:large subunit ribosomal protein L4
MALTDKVKNEQLILVDDFTLPEIKTKKFIEAMRYFDVPKALIVTGEKSANLEKSSKIVSWVKVMRHEGLNVYDILTYDYLFLEQSAVSQIEEALIS